MTTTNIRERYTQTMQNTFGTPKLVITRGNGVYVEDDNGTQYLDLLAGIAVNALGYAHPALVDAITTQAQSCTHVSNFFATPAQVDLAERLQSIFRSEGYSGDIRSFFTNSGAEANEAALKLARLHKPGGRVLALTHSFHGRTMGALTLTHKEAYRAPFEPLAGTAQFVEPTSEALEDAFDDNVAAIFIEPIQGEAGVLPVAPDVLHTARKLCDKHNALLIFDEVQTGIGRTGRWLASAAHVHGDIVTLAKGLGGGVPIGACVAIGAVASLFQPGNHGTTFGGNPLACAAALATLTEVATLMDSVRDTSTWLVGELENIGYSVRGAGLLLGVTVRDAQHAAQVLLNEAIIVNAPNPTTIRLAPPLIITPEQLTPFVDAMRRHAPDFLENA